jgi:tRNA threonylcarbamoyladenosine biosynthesis protein TsaE
MAKNAATRCTQWISMPRDSLDLNLVDSSVTEILGQALARSLPGAGHDGVADGGVAVGPGIAASGAVVYLQGELGAGKTTCVRSLLRTLGVVGLVRSPTYTLVETYPLPTLTCVHVDLYRLQSLGEVDELGLRDLLGPGCLLLVEWPERGAAALPPADLNLTLRYADHARQAAIAANTSLGSRWLENLGHDTSLVPYVYNLT